MRMLRFRIMRTYSEKSVRQAVSQHSVCRDRSVIEPDDRAAKTDDPIDRPSGEYQDLTDKQNR